MNKTIHLNGSEVELSGIEQKAGSLRFSLNGHDYHFRSQRLEDGSFLLEEELAAGIWQASIGGAWKSGRSTRTVQVGGLEGRITEAQIVGDSVASVLSPVAPMPGVVRQVLVKKGDKVARGQTLVVVEAMKLQLALPAGADAIVDAVLVKEGQQVSEGAELIKLTAK